ncbi:MAG: aspartyl protease family protein [Planctomycetota bacterium]|jgi:hypothetical protein
MARIHEIAPVVLLTIYSLGCAGDRTEHVTASVARTRVIEQFSIPKAPGPILVPVRLKGQVSSFLLDTGASVNCFDRSCRALLGDPLDAAWFRTGGATQEFKRFRAPEAYLGGLSISGDSPVICEDLRMFGAVVGRDVVGVVGMSFLRNHVVQIDFDNGKLILLESTAGEHPEWGEAVQLGYDADGLPFVRARLGEMDIDLLIDTGMNMSGTLEGELYDKMIRKNKAITTSTKAETAAGTVEMSLGRAPAMSLGPFIYKHLIFGRGSPSALGLALLSRHVVTFDFPGNRMYLKKGPMSDKNDNADMSGLSLLRAGAKTLVYGVDERSPAEKAGIEAKDVIVRIGSDDVDALEMWEIRQLLRSGDGREINLTIKRGEKVFDVSFHLRREL